MSLKDSSKFLTYQRGVLKIYENLLAPKHWRFSLFAIAQFRFKSFLLEVGNGLRIEKRNELNILPLYSNDYRHSIVDLTMEYKSFDHMVDKNFICFGMTGGDSETYAFHTGYRYNNGEYPIAWMIPGDVGDKTYHLVNNRFDAFISVQYYSLIDFNDLGHSHKEYIEWFTKEEWDEEEEILERKEIILESYEIKGITPVLDEYECLMTGNELIEKIKKSE